MPEDMPIASEANAFEHSKGYRVISDGPNKYSKCHCAHRDLKILIARSGLVI